MPNAQHRFGELRSLMNLDHLEHSERIQLWKTIQACAQDTPEEFSSKWSAYLESFPHHFEQPLTTLLSIEGLVHAVHLLPFARFALDLKNRRLQKKGIKQLIKCQALECVTHLNLGHNNLQDDAIHILCSSEHLSHVTSLALRNNSFGPEGAQAIANTPYLSQVTDLDISGNSIGASGAKALAESPYLPKTTRDKFNTLHATLLKL